MIILTGAAGFIGSCLLTKLNESGFYRDVVLVDDFYRKDKEKNTDNKAVREWMHRDIFLNWLENSTQKIDFIIHMGARTDTTLFDKDIFDQLNLNYSKRIWKVCVNRQIPLIYASSAATYGIGDKGFSDAHQNTYDLLPLNPYGQSKQDFDIWALNQTDCPPFWVGCKFFNVYGPNEYHKSRMASVIYHTYQQIKNTGAMKLFKSHKEGIADGHQSRDFIYVKDILEMILFFMQSQHTTNGIYNFGTGQARTFYDLAHSTFLAIDQKTNVSYIDTPEDIRDTYQYYTQADISKLRQAGYDKPFWSLEDGVDDYVNQYLISQKYY